MSKEKLDLQPRTLGERLFASTVHNSRTKGSALTLVASGVVCLSIHFLWAWEINPFGPMLCMGLICLFSAVWGFERHIAYKLLKRQQEEIERLKMACSTNEST